MCSLTLMIKWYYYFEIVIDIYYRETESMKRYKCTNRNNKTLKSFYSLESFFQMKNPLNLFSHQHHNKGRRILKLSHKGAKPSKKSSLFHRSLHWHQSKTSRRCSHIEWMVISMKKNHLRQCQYWGLFLRGKRCCRDW
jgi:hypothetical protein